MPEGLRLANFESDDVHLPSEKGQSGLQNFVKSQIDIDLRYKGSLSLNLLHTDGFWISWDDIEDIIQSTHLPVILKGIMHPLDALKALEIGAAGIIVSNHGGRQLDDVPSTIEVLPDIVQVIRGKIPVILDGGVRKGTDIFKALALGAQAVMVGRPVLWGLACYGQKGVQRVLEILRNELRETMILAGCRRIGDIHGNFVDYNGSRSLFRGSKL